MNEVETNPEATPAPDRAPAMSGPEFAVATQPSYARTLFLDPDGLRPGWGFLFYALMFLALQRVNHSVRVEPV